MMICAWQDFFMTYDKRSLYIFYVHHNDMHTILMYTTVTCILFSSIPTWDVHNLIIVHWNVPLRKQHQMHILCVNNIKKDKSSYLYVHHKHMYTIPTYTLNDMHAIYIYTGLRQGGCLFKTALSNAANFTRRRTEARGIQISYTTRAFARRMALPPRGE